MLLESVLVLLTERFQVNSRKIETIQFCQEQVSLSVINITLRKYIVWLIDFIAAFYTYNENQLSVEEIWLCEIELNCFLKACLNSTSWREVQ